ncbi:MAG: phosphoglucosamine mutase [Acidimicrobiales bacterium]|nr:phosphoglucosamine mutase [Acidimicrobiales bacterium]
MHFGTDGIRGVANDELTPEIALYLGRAVARVLSPKSLVLGRDPRISGKMLANAFASGVMSEGVDVIDVGIAPTPGVAYVGNKLELPSAVVSASHNPFGDNGIKVFGFGGTKIDDIAESEIERRLNGYLENTLSDKRPIGKLVGSESDGKALLEGWLQSVAEAFQIETFGLKVVVDLANGATAKFVAPLLDRFGIQVVTINAQSDGISINENCGATSTRGLQEAVVQHGADLGLAFDGDGDRLVAVDASGKIVNGDQIIAVMALDLLKSNKLENSAVAVTVMSNLGFHKAMDEAGIKVFVTPVGDRHVLKVMERENLTLGGEQSGHIIRRDHSTTGDGLLAACLLLDILGRNNSSLKEMANISIYPQVLESLRVNGLSQDGAKMLAQHEEIALLVDDLTNKLEGQGRILVRASGTEPVVRVMVEASDEVWAKEIVGDLVVKLTELSSKTT